MMTKVGSVILAIGIAALCYGALAFWVLPGLPPNGGNSGRLPSLYILFAGVALTLVGLAVRGLRTSAASRDQSGKREVSPAAGLLLILILVAAIFAVVAML